MKETQITKYYLFLSVSCNDIIQTEYCPPKTTLAGPSEGFSLTALQHQQTQSN